MRHIALWTTVSIGLWAGCGDGGNVCDPSNCAGCCAVDGTCVAGDTSGQCGTGGATCAACSPGSCSAGKCVTCDATSCAGGCCLGDQCLSGNVPTACGKAGVACVVCQNNDVCSEGACKAPGACGPATCPGCCQGDQCLGGTTEAACGKGGVACVGCQVPAQACVNQVCSGSGPCNDVTCSDGCCDAQGQCMPGDTDAACGTGGVACAQCSGRNPCTNKQCSGGGCGPGSCSGCCDGATCQPGNTLTACGKGGIVCQVCAKYQLCGNQCDLNPDSTWGVTVVDAEILKPPLGEDWDPGSIPGFIEPDVFVEVKSGTHSGKTGTEDNTQTPFWNKQVFVAKASELQQSLNLKVVDEDPVPPDQIIGQCTQPIAAAELVAGARTVTNCGGADVVKINLTFTAK